jgi:hypothetical protein
MKTQVQWLAPSLLWQELSSAKDLTAYRRPAILRFATDTFMQDLQSVLQTAPPTLRNYVAAAENWRTPAAGLDPAVGNTLPLKLYQPVHQRFYLIASSLTCRKPGLPDHTINTSAGENVAFVVRQLRPNPGYEISDTAVYDPTKCSEYAWIPATAGVQPAAGSGAASNSGASAAIASPAGGAASTGTTASTASSSGTQPGWMQVGSPTALVPGEEQIPLSLTQFGSNGGSRRLYIGLIPASRRQQYISGRTLPINGGASGNGGNASGASTSGSGSTGSSGSGSNGNGNGTPSDPRMDRFYREVVGPWCSLLDWWNHLDNPLPAAENVPPEQISQMSSALILCDFATFLSTYLPNVWGVISGSASASTLSSAEATLYSQMGTTWQQALVNANNNENTFEQAGPDESANWPPAGYSPIGLTDASLSSIAPTKLQTLVQNALPPLSSVPPGTDATPLPPLAQQPTDPLGNYYYVIRCVYLRPQCCAYMPQCCNVFSPPTQPFLLTNYFDSDAPARRIQVALPVDTSAAALRKYDKGIAFLVSDELRNQMARVASLNDLADGNIGASPGIGVGWICSFSIPIITICAFILLFVIVIALNLVFFWIPFFRICFPVPTLQAKQS